jgi:hypothetical protein
MCFIIGDKLYEVRVRYDIKAKKITKIDELGLEWYRYESPPTKYEILEWTVIGITVTTLIGDASQDASSDLLEGKTYHLRSKDIGTVCFYESELKSYLTQAEYWFFDERVAENKIKTIGEM